MKYILKALLAYAIIITIFGVPILIAFGVVALFEVAPIIGYVVLTILILLWLYIVGKSIKMNNNKL
jgi:hypothetical protein